MDQNAARRAGFAAEGEATVRSRVGMGHHSPYNEEHRAAAIVWLDEIDRRRAADAETRAQALNSELTVLQRRTADAAEAAASAARDSASAAASANEIARAANELASDANAFASRASRRAEDANRIAIAAAIIAALTAIGSIVAALLRAP